MLQTGYFQPLWTTSTLIKMKMKDVFNSSEMIMKTCLLFKYPFKYNVQNVAKKKHFGKDFLSANNHFRFP